ncbi:hypothetical protein NEOLEDRAFT_1240477 [Neolentinus lepideus HHB14362 ss-1]|uniref:Fungal-type protein kinase domain-containing protein n=1 Tax=Neolentinus lepideus HHB14362 ss-1 TaxID=1314782 RepID=A0A165TU60_9AGAM|nr:hypothetical protein NEOLEDRAFT_1240477 [Neolentinus lepideus HHB14362 ss-1]
MKRKTTGSRVHALEPPVAKERRKQHAMDMRGKFLSIDPQSFLDTFLPINEGSGVPPSIDLKAFEPMEEIDGEREMYLPWVNCVETNNFCPGYKFVAMPDKGDRNDCRTKGRQVPDVGLYLKKDAPVDTPRWSKMALYVEFKSRKEGLKQDPFCDDPRKPFESDAEERESVRGQIIGYAEAMFSHQHRTHVFSLLVLGEHVRFIRWDRSGAIVSQLVHYVEDPEILAHFLWRFSNLAPSQAGFDLTAEEIDEESLEYHLMKSGPNDESLTEKQRQYWQESLDESWSWWKLKVGGCDCSSRASRAQVPRQNMDPKYEARDHVAATERPRYFLVGRPHFKASRLDGRGTRGYIAMDPETKKLHYLKDCWRVTLPGIQKEGDVLRALHDAKV